MRISAIILAMLAVTLLAGCRTVAVIPIAPHVRIVHTVNAPPPHAPAHGYRHHHHDLDMEYDSQLGVYIVIGYDGLFYFNNVYMHFYDGYWYRSDSHNGNWLRDHDNHVPHKLRKGRKHWRKKHGHHGKKLKKIKVRSHNKNHKKSKKQRKKKKHKRNHDDDHDENRRERGNRH